MANNKKMIYAELRSKVKEYFDELKESTGMSNSGVVRYAIIEAWKQWRREVNEK